MKEHPIELPCIYKLKVKKSPEDFGHGQAESYVRKIDQKKKLKHD